MIDDGLPPLPRRTPRQRWDRFVYLWRCWGPVWSWKCTYSYEYRNGRWRAFLIWLDDGFFGAVWDLVRHGR